MSDNDSNVEEALEFLRSAEADWKYLSGAERFGTILQAIEVLERSAAAKEEADETSEWPKTWAEIRDAHGSHEGDPFNADSWVLFDEGLRAYKGTMYASVDIGRETEETRDEWLPLSLYIKRAAKGVEWEETNTGTTTE